MNGFKGEKVPLDENILANLNTESSAYNCTRVNLKRHKNIQEEVFADISHTTNISRSPLL